MKATVILVLFAVIALVAAGRGKGGGGKGKGHWKKMKICNKEEANMEGMNATITECKSVFEGSAQESDSKEEMKNKFGKFMICMWDKQGVLKDNKISREMYIEQCKAMFKTNGEKLGTHIANECFNEKHKIDSLNKDEPSTFNDVFGCVKRAWGDICPEAKRGRGKGGKKKNKEDAPEEDGQ